MSTRIRHRRATEEYQKELNEAYLNKSEDETQLIKSWVAKNIPQLTGNSGEFGSSLSKATRPQDFKSIVRALDPEGKNYVDHKAHLDAHPSEHNDLVGNYRSEILGSSKVYKKTPTAKGGITQKVIFKTKNQGPQEVSLGDFVPENTSMVKPYHERVSKRLQGWQQFPVQGWAEMANQALYHAAGIGHLHQKVHVSEHDMGNMNKAEPALVIHMESGFSPIYKHPGKTKNVPEQQKHNALKIGLMDFLSNNLDRHGGNLMVKVSHHQAPEATPTPALQSGPKTLLDNLGREALDLKNNPETRVSDKPALPTPDIEDIKAIDHSRSFQYVNNHDFKHMGKKFLKNQIKSGGLEDSFRSYIWGSGTSVGDIAPKRPKDYDEKLNFLREYGEPLLNWWGEVGPRVRETMHKQLNSIKNPEAREHIKRNFDARADWLDERAKFGIENFGVDWDSSPVPQYHPTEKTSEELQKEKVAQAKVKWAQKTK